ncbi:MAG: helix-turn-helix transcriptional regulator [Clostridia bacterium]|nr:helix-turn-helix transcriptional regulator [Clostridia bacterium]
MQQIMRIKAAREAAEMTQTELCERVGVSQGVVSCWESETFLPRTRQLPQLAAVLGCSINDLFEPTDASA